MSFVHPEKDLGEVADRASPSFGTSSSETWRDRNMIELLVTDEGRGLDTDRRQAALRGRPHRPSPGRPSGVCPGRRVRDQARRPGHAHPVDPRSSTETPPRDAAVRWSSTRATPGRLPPETTSSPSRRRDLATYRPRLRGSVSCLPRSRCSLSCRRWRTRRAMVSRRLTIVLTY